MNIAEPGENVGLGIGLGTGLEHSRTRGKHRRTFGKPLTTAKERVRKNVRVTGREFNEIYICTLFVFVTLARIEKCHSVFFIYQYPAHVNPAQLCQKAKIAEISTGCG